MCSGDTKAHFIDLFRKYRRNYLNIFSQFLILKLQSFPMKYGRKICIFTFFIKEYRHVSMLTLLSFLFAQENEYNVVNPFVKKLVTNFFNNIIELLSIQLIFI